MNLLWNGFLLVVSRRSRSCLYVVPCGEVVVGRCCFPVLVVLIWPSTWHARNLLEDQLMGVLFFLKV